MCVGVSEDSDECIEAIEPLARPIGRAMEDGTIAVLYVSTGEPVTRMDLDQCYPVGSPLSVRYEHAEGIYLTRDVAQRIGLEIEED